MHVNPVIRCDEDRSLGVKMDLGLEGKTALVTGASQGIGKAIALALALEGVDVAINARTRETLNEAAREINRETGRQVLPVVADVTKTEEVEAMVKKVVSAFGRLNILVNNAGVPGGLAGSVLEEVTDEAMFADLNTKFLGYLRCARAAAPFMKKEGWGRIVNVGGGSARRSGLYSTGSRNIAIAHLSKTMSDELGPSGINVNVVHPGTTANTALIDQGIEKQAQREGKSFEEVVKERGQENAIRRLPTANEVAFVVTFLASPRAAAVTGEVISAGGGSIRAVFT